MNDSFSLYTDPSQNFIEAYAHPLDAIFHPEVVAVIGAKDDLGSVGRTIMTNLLSANFKGKVIPINPKRSQVLGIPCLPNLASAPLVDLAIIVTPAFAILSVMQDCIKAKVKSVVIISAGFKELGEQGLLLENKVVQLARSASIPLIGPNCLGIMNPHKGLNATFARGMALPGNIAFISQSGAMCTAVLDWSLQQRVGFSSFVSIGSMADVHWGNLIDYFGNDPHTRSLLLYMETIGDARAFMTAARQVALEKPIIVIKPGRSEAAAKAAASHTGSLSGSDQVFDAALQRVGVLRVDSIAELFSMASLLSKQPLPKGPNLSIITNAGGPAVLATDATVTSGAVMTELQQRTVEELNNFLPSAWSHGNPIDILGDADASRYSKTVEKAVQDEKSDGLLVILSPQDMTEATETAQSLCSIDLKEKPLLASWMGGETVEIGKKLLNQASIPCFNYPDEAAKAFAKMWQYSQTLKDLYEIPTFSNAKNIEKEQKERVHQLIEEARKKGQLLLSESMSKELIECYHLPIVKTFCASDREEATVYAEKIGYPVVLKLFSNTITHKTDVGGVKLNLKNKEQVEAAYQDIFNAVTACAGKEAFQGVTVQKMISSQGYELILGSSTDPQFGPVILFGLGGQLVEVFKDSALAIPPLTNTLAHQLMAKTKVYQALKGVRGMAAINIEKLEEILVYFSQLIMENPQIKECDINPLIVSENEILALDARIVLHDLKEALPPPSIRPYPLHYVKQLTLKNQLMVILRPICPEDVLLIKQFHTELSENSVYQRFFAFVSLDKRVAENRLTRICFNDYDREIAIVAEIKEAEKAKIVGVGRISRAN